MRQRGWWLVLLLSLLSGACEPAHRYKSAPAEEKEAEIPPGPIPAPDYAYQPSTPPWQTPIVFIQADKQPDEWKRLSDFWNPSAARPVPIGIGPLEAAVVVAAALDL